MNGTRPMEEGPAGGRSSGVDERSAAREGSGEGRRGGARTPTPPTLLLLGLLAEVVLSLGAPSWSAPGWPWAVAGIPVLVGGIALMIAGDREFARQGTPIRPGTHPTTLVTTGVFAWSRNPMYLGIVLVLAGVAVLLGAATPWFVPPAVAWILTRVFVVPEERALRREFGDRYERYALRVRRWL